METGLIDPAAPVSAYPAAALNQQNMAIILQKGGNNRSGFKGAAGYLIIHDIYQSLVGHFSSLHGMIS